MLPFTVARLSSCPPLPTLPLSRRGLMFPDTVIGNSLSMLPLTVSARSSALSVAGTVSVTLPLTVLNAAVSFQSARPAVAAQCGGSRRTAACR